MKIACIQVVCPTYKVKFFSEISERCGVDFYIGDKNNSSVAPNADDLSFAKGRLKNKFIRFLGVDWLYQSGFSISDIRSYDYIIIPISVPFYLNYKIIFWSRVFGVKVGMYGMGINYQKKSLKQTGFLEFLRGLLYRFTSFSIVYTESIKKTLIGDFGVPKQKIFVAPNTLAVEAISSVSVNVGSVRGDLGIKPDELLITYVGRLSSQKNPEILLLIPDLLRAKGIQSKVVFIGTGLEENGLKALAEGRKDIVFMGQLSEEMATKVLKSSDYSVMPGMTGLAVVHSFASKVLYITVESPLHSPEFEYIENNVNGCVVKPEAKAIAEKIVELETNPQQKKEIETAAYDFAINDLSLEAQVAGFVGALKSIGANE